MGGSPEAASKNHYFTRGSLATLANHLQSPGEGGPRCEKQIPVVPQPGDHVTDGCLVWILARVWSHSSFSPVPSESCTPRGFFFSTASSLHSFLPRLYFAFILPLSFSHPVGSRAPRCPEKTCFLMSMSKNAVTPVLVLTFHEYDLSCMFWFVADIIFKLFYFFIFLFFAHAAQQVLGSAPAPRATPEKESVDGNKWMNICMKSGEQLTANVSHLSCTSATSQWSGGKLVVTKMSTCQE